MSLRKKFFAATYDSFSRKTEEAGLRVMRQGLLSEASGSVLEVGAGTGANLAHNFSLTASINSRYYR